MHIKSNEKYASKNKLEEEHEYRKGVRESMSRLPSWLQPIITIITGKPLPNENPVIKRAPMNSFLITVFVLFV